MLRKKFKAALVASVALILVSAGGCGQKADQNTRKVGPEGPTSPGGYYFTLEVHPAIVQALGTVSVIAQVTNAAGTPINGTVTPVMVNFSGSATSGSSVAIDSNGIAGFFLTMTGTGGRIAYVNANVEDKSLNIPIQILP